MGDKLIVDMFYSDNHVEVSLDAFLASEEYAKESVKELKINQGSVFDKNAAGSDSVTAVKASVSSMEYVLDSLSYSLQNNSAAYFELPVPLKYLPIIFSHSRTQISS